MPGRNDPCPCGSGKKFKKCCVDKPRVQEKAPVLLPGRRSLAALPEELGGLGYFTKAAALAIIDEHPDAQQLNVTLWVRARLQDRLQVGPRGSTPAFTIQSVRAWPTGELLAQSAAAGGPGDEVAFLAATDPEQRHACDLAAEWPNTPKGSELLLGLVAAELWRRLLPHVPSYEMLDENLDVGFGHFHRGELSDALRVWTQFVSDLGDAVPAEVTSLAEADTYLCGFELLTNWIGEIKDDFYNAVLDTPDLRGAVITLYNTIALRFTDELRAMRLASADIMSISGAASEAVALYDQLLELDPYDIDAAVGQSLALAGSARSPGVDPSRALAILEAFRGHSRAADYDVEERIRDLRSGAW